MQMQTIELRCPYCHAAQTSAGAGQHTCEYCLRGFTAVDAARALQQSAAQADAWLRERVGAGGEAEVIDRASRGYIFNQRILPELRRDAARAGEGLGAWLQAPLILPELARGTKPASHPLVTHAGRMRALVELRGRLDHEEVRRFATDEVTQRQLADLGAPIDELIHLINVAEAGLRGAEGWQAVGSNLEALAKQAQRRGSDEATILQVERWHLLAALARHYGDCARDQHPPSQLEAIEAIVVGLGVLGERLRGSSDADVRARASALAVEQEAAGARILARWLRCRERLPGARALSLPQLSQTLAPLLPHGDPERNLALLEAWTELAAVARQEASIHVDQDFSWVAGWAESQRRRKRLGLFGEDEVVEAIEPFLLPVWIVELGYSQRRGHLLGGGVEQRVLAVLDACASTPDKLVIFDPPPTPLQAALAQPLRVDTAELALPETSEAEARAVVQQALRQHPERQNARFALRGLALVSAATVWLRTAKGQRQITAAMAGRIPTSPRARARLDTGRWLFSQFSR